MVRIGCNYKFDKPLINIKLSNGQNEINTMGLLDSGADMTLIPKTVGDDLKLNNPSKDELSRILSKDIVLGDGRRVIYVERNIDLSIGDKYKTRITVAWLQSSSKDAIVLLGRNLFAKFDIVFKEREKRVILETDSAIFN